MYTLHKKLLPIYAIFLIVTLLCARHIFFWDTYQLCGRQAWALFDNGLAHWILPQEIDSGHPPLFGFYHAALWKIFGANVIVSHLGMLPFLWGIVYYLFRIGNHLLDQSKSVYLILFLLADPVFMGQAVLVSPDIVLLFFMLFCFFGVLKDHKFYIVVGALGLGLISMRGMMVLFAIIIFNLLYNNKRLEPWKAISSIANYVPALVSVFFFLALHYIHTGWIGHHPESSWAGSFEIVDLKDLVKNIAVLGWRFLDFGRLVLLFSLMYLAYLFTLKVPDKKVIKLLIFLILLSIIICPVLLLHKGLVLHRYLLPIFLVMHILFWYLLMQSKLPMKMQKGLLMTVLASLFLGNLWVYPAKISQGWDATLGHIPYYHLRDNMIHYLDENNIALSDVGTAFPNIGDMRNFDPSDQREGFAEYDLSRNEYLFYSNVYNDFSDEELDLLASEAWNVQQEYYFYPVCVVLYKREE